MNPWSLLDTAPIPGGGALRLMQRGAEFSIKLGDNELMNSRLGGSEERLAAIACEALADRPAKRLLIGGLGMGFTLRAALERLGPSGRIDIVELIPEVVDWASGVLASLFGTSLQDPRVQVRIDDVGHVIHSSSSRYDAILMDVDNGPDGLTTPANETLYSLNGLIAARSALRPGGLLLIWSAGPDATFAERLRKAGFGVSDVKVRANGERGGARHRIWIGEKPSSMGPRRQPGPKLSTPTKLSAPTKLSTPTKMGR